MRRKGVNYIPLFLFLVALLVGLHQLYYWGYFFELKDIHHETFMVALVFAGLISCFELFIRKRGSRR